MNKSGAALLLALLLCEATPMLADQPGPIPKFGLFELTLQSQAKYDNPFWDAPVSATFTSPSGKQCTAEGFYFGADQWRVRFAPREEGQWKYAATLGRAADLVKKEGTFECKGAAGHGFLQLSKRNGFRMEYEDGTPFYPIGIQTCGFLRPDFDGPNEQGKWRNVPTEEWLKAFTGAVNLVRTQFGQGTGAGCALSLIAAPPPAPRPTTASGTTTATAAAPPPFKYALDRYDLDLAEKIDQTYLAHRAAGMAQILILFQDMSLWGGGGSGLGGGRDLSDKGYKSVKAANLPLQEKYIRYIVARYGAFVDIWELFNEDSYSPNDYLAHLAEVVRKADPYGRIITTNYARPAEPWCQIVTFHEYMGMPAQDVDAYLAGQFALYKSYGKVVQNTEFGNQGQLSNYDPVKWRIAVWTAYMNECGLLFWGMSGSKTKAGGSGGGNANAYIGPDSRQHFRVLNEFNHDMPIDMKPVPIGYHEHTDFRISALSNGAVTAIYVHHFADHDKVLTYPDKLMVNTGPGRFKLRWIDPADGREIKTEELKTVAHYLEFKLPPVKVDLACRIDRLAEKP